MEDKLNFYIDGAWTAPQSQQTKEVINPATEEPTARIGLANTADQDKAVAAARRAFVGYSVTDRGARLDLLGQLREIYKRRQTEMAEAISAEMGAPIRMAMRSQAAAGRCRFRAVSQQIS